MHNMLRLMTIGLLASIAAFAQAQQESPTVEVRFHYEDLDRAVRFYAEHLGLQPLETREEAVVLEVAPGARLTLATLESGGFSPDTPRTAAIALITDQLDAWWAALSKRGLDMRSKSFAPKPGSAHDGFVLADPEGWLLEFERFNPHPENTQLMPLLDALTTRVVDHVSTGLPAGLGFKATVLWLYYRDLGAAETFVVDTLGYPLVADQGWAKVHPLSPSAYLGLVDGARGMHAFTDEKAVWLDIMEPEAQARRRTAEASGAPVESLSETVFELRDPGGHLLRYRDTAGSP